MDVTPASIQASQDILATEASPAPKLASTMSTTAGTCTCSSCILAAENSLSLADVSAGESIKTKKKERYAPPKPDADTFVTQQAFLDSLIPISIDSITKNCGKCPICWKPYGEAADPGFDNSEQPVRLKCSHTFGDKCLRTTFALPGTSTITLRPLCFSPGSRGRLLGQRLHAHYQKQPAEALDGYVGAFTKMLAAKSDIRSESFGQHWGSVVLELRSSIPAVSVLRKITLLENAMILDRKSSMIGGLVLPYEIPEGFSSFTIPSGYGLQLPMTQPPSGIPAPPPFDPEEIHKQQKKADKMAEERNKTVAESRKAHRELQERNERDFNGMLAVELVRIYSAYLKRGTTKEEPEQEASSLPNHYVSAPIYVHKKNLEQSSYEIASIGPYIEHALQQDDDGSDTDGDDLSITNDAVFENLFPVVIREMCTSCWSSHTNASCHSQATIPTSLWWKNSRKSPDDCPICHRVLYHKEGYRQISHYLSCETAGADDSGDKTEGEKVT